MNDEELVTRAIREAEPTLLNPRGAAYLAAVSVAALSAAGRLLPEGGASYDQYCVGDHLCCLLAGGSENFVHVRPEKRHTHVQSRTEYPDGSVLTGPWREVTP